MINFNESKGNDKYKIQHRPYLQNSKGEKKLKFGTDPKRYTSLKLGSGYLKSPLCVL